jgi:hypothetical protein
MEKREWLFQGNSPLTRAFHLLWLCVILFLTVSCSSTGLSKGNEDGFNFVVENFHNAVRWGEYQAASTYVGPTMQEDFWQIADALKNRVAIMDCRIKRSSYDGRRKSGNIVLYVEYHALGDPKVITRTINEHWTFNEKDKMWRLVSHDFAALEP